jgi:hypothetical protein
MLQQFQTFEVSHYVTFSSREVVEVLLVTRSFTKQTSSSSPESLLNYWFGEGSPTPCLTLWFHQTRVQWPFQGTMGNLVASRKHIFDWLITDHSWLRKVKNKGRACGSKNFSEEELSTLQMVDETMGQVGCSALCPRQRAEPWMEASGMMRLSKWVREAHPKAETKWFHTGSWNRLGANASQGGCSRAPVLWSLCR